MSKKITGFLTVILTIIMVAIVMPVAANAGTTANAFVALKGDTLYFYGENSDDGYGEIYNYLSLKKEIGEIPYKIADSYSYSNLPQWYEDGLSAKATKIVIYGSMSFCNIKPSNMDYWFYGCSNATSIEGLEYIKCDNLTSLDSTFRNCSSLTEIDLSSFNTSKVTRTRYMFDGCSNLVSVYVGPDWNLINVVGETNGKQMFNGCKKIVGYSGTTYNSAVTDDTYGELDAGDVKGYLTTNVGEPFILFEDKGEGECDLTLYYGPTFGAGFKEMQERGDVVVDTNKDLMRSIPEKYPWYSRREETTRVIIDKSFANYKLTQAWRLFDGFNNVTSFVGLENLNTSQTKDMSFLFSDCKALKSIDISSLDMSNVEDMTNMFMDCTSLESVIFGDSQTANVTNMHGLFSGCNKLTTVDLSNLDTSNVVSMDYMFCECDALTELDLSVLDTSNLLSMEYMFFGCDNLKSLKLNGMNTSNVRNMNSLFASCTGIEKLDLSAIDTTNVIDMGHMFSSCLALTDLNLTNLNTSKVQNMRGMFSACTSLEVLDLSSFNTSSLSSTYLYKGDSTDAGISEMFYGCSSLKTVIVTFDWDPSGEVIRNAQYVFLGAPLLTGGAGTRHSTSHLGGDYADIDMRNGYNVGGYFTAVVDISFEGSEGATGEAPESIRAIQGTTITLPSESSLSKSGYKLSGWTNVNSSISYLIGSSFKVPGSNVTFTANWEKDNGSGSGSGNGSGSGTPTPTSNPTPSGNPTPGGEVPGGDGKTPGGTSPTPTPTTTPGGDGKVPGGEPTQAPELDVGAFITRCYEVAFGREPDENGYYYWVNNLNNGLACGAQVGYGFIYSAEYLNKATNNEQFVNDMYAMYFGREADADGFKYWKDQLDNGTDREVVMAGFINSLEFFNLCEKYGVVCGSYIIGVSNEQQGGVNCFVARLYKVCLNRLPDQGGQAGWVMKLLDGEVTGTTCAYGFVFSPEFINMDLDNTDYVKYMYNAFFGRDADEAGLNYWVSQLNGCTASREDVFAGFAGSVEFANLCASYGINA